MYSHIKKEQKNASKGAAQQTARGNGTLQQGNDLQNL
jgi:hypothetical protein